MFDRQLAIGIIAYLLCSGSAIGQATAPTASSRKFEVVSIRQNLSKTGGPATQSFGPTADGYRMADVPLTAAILAAYVPSNAGPLFSFDNIVGLPELMSLGSYDIDARISDADRADWRDPKKQPEMLQEMLQAMLAERFHFVAHREFRTSNIYSLQVAKGGPKFQASNPDEPHEGIAIPGGGGFMGSNGDGGGLVRFSDTTMATFAAMISTFAGRTIRDDTGLAGRYDLSFPKPSFAAAPPADGNSNLSDPQPTIFSVAAGLGLKLEPAKGQVETLVIDHVEKPTAN